MLLTKMLQTFGEYLVLMGRVFSRPERLRIQIKLNIESAWMPKWVSGYVTREIMLLEFSSSIMCLILAGKVGSNIASEIGTMRVTQQIDALEIMGVNSASYVILPPARHLFYHEWHRRCLCHSLHRAHHHTGPPHRRDSVRL